MEPTPRWYVQDFVWGDGGSETKKFEFSNLDE
jgi:hypothetical protein